MSASTVTAGRRPSVRALLGEQALVAAGQLAAGIGNLVFALLAVRVLAPGAFADLAVFLALFLVVHVPLASLSAGSAVTPDFAAAHRRRAAGLGVLGGLVLAGLAPVVAPPLDVPVALLLVLAAGAPSAGWLALERGRLFGAGRYRRAVASLVAEPVLRLGCGLPLAASFGAVGGAAGVVAGGWAALAVTAPGSPLRGARRPVSGGPAAAATLAFLGLAVLQNQDVVLANAVLGEGEAARFAVLSTLGGVAAFATTTVPLVLLSRARDATPARLHAALLAAGVLGAAAMIATAAVPQDWVAQAFGDRYAGVAPLVAPYVGGMALLGVGRVLVAERVAAGGGLRLLPALTVIAVAQGVAVVAAGSDARTVAAITVAAMTALVAAGAIALWRADRAHAVHAYLAGAVDLPEAPPARHVPEAPDAAPAPAAPRRPAEEARAPREAVPWRALILLTVVALIARGLITRGLWLDEAISVDQAKMPLGALIEDLRTTDVHPPLHHLVLWAIAHTAGTEEWMIRAPSILAGALLVPALYATGHVLWDRRAGLLAAALATFAPFLVWYAQEARMYAFFMLFATLALLGQAWALQGGGRRAWALYAVSSALLLWTQWFGLLVVAVQQAAFLALAVSRGRGDRAAGWAIARGWAGATVLLALLCAPLLPLGLDQFAANEAAGRGFDQGPSQAGDVTAEQERPDIYAVLTNMVWAVAGYHSNGTLEALTALWPLAMLGALVLLGRRPTWRAHLVIAVALVPAAVLLALGMAKPFLFEIRYFIAAAPLLLLLVARGVTAWVRRPAAIAGVGILLVAASAVATVDEQLNGANPRRYDFEGALAQVAERMRPGDVLVYEPEYLEEVIRYYQPDLRASKLQDGLPERRWATRVFLLSSFQERPAHRRNTADALRRLRAERRLVTRFSRPQVKVVVFR